MTSMGIALPPARFRPPPDPPPCRFPLLGSLSPFEPLEPPDPPDPPDISPAPVLLRQFIVASPNRRLSSAVHLFTALSLCFTWIVHEFLMLLGFLTSSAVASCKRWSRCRFHVLWLLALTCNPPPALMTALTSDLFHETCALLPPFRSSCNIRWPDLKNLRRASPSLSPWAMTLLPSGKIYSDWTWCERELHSDVLLLPLDRSVKIYSEHQVPFSPVRNPLLEDIRTSIFSPQTSFRYTPPGICSLMPSLLDFDDQRVYLGSVNTLWIRHGNVGIRSFCLNSTLSCSSNLVKFLSQDAIIKAVCSSLSNLTQPCFPVSAICAQQPSHPIDPSVSCSSWSRTIMELEMKRPATELCNLGLELFHYLFGAVTGINPQISSRSPHKPSAPTSEKAVARLFQTWSFSELEDCSPLVFSLLKRLIKFPHAKDHERSFPHVLLLLRILPSKLLSMRGTLLLAPKLMNIVAFFTACYLV